MKIAITWDYELFFGERSGSVAQCMLEPTDRLLKLASKYNIPFTFFPDAGCLIRFEEQADCHQELQRVKTQIQSWDSLGHETGLHIHPHWEKSSWMDGRWQHDLSHYKLSDFSAEEASHIVERYASYMNSILAHPLQSYRAGGWCAQPFTPVAEAMKKVGIRYDSSVFKGGKNTSSPYQYDFTVTPSATHWKFTEDPAVLDSEGAFTEIPIASMNYSPLFFWKLFVLGRLNPGQHKPIGNGLPAKGGGSKKDLLTRSHHLCVSADGYFSTQLNRALRKAQRANEPFLVVIGHPKALTPFGLHTLEAFIAQHYRNHEFVTLSSIL
jgi:peptidoglycan/xylan/chitin deacetylase (PgdA/CDA1 family)